MPKFRIKEGHPLYQKIDKVFALMEELGLTIHHTENGFLIEDKSIPNINFFIKDIEDDGHYGNDQIESLPPFMEFKIVFDKD